MIFYIPRHKTTFRTFIEHFVDQYCQKKMVKLIDELNETKIGRHNDGTIYLLDEVYDTELIRRNINRGKIFAVVIQTEVRGVPSNIFLRSDVDFICLRKIYRSPEQIGKICAKLKRVLDMNFTERTSNATLASGTSALQFTSQDIPWEMSFSNQPPLSENSPIEIKGYTSWRNDDLSKYVLNLEESEFLVVWGFEEENVKELVSFFRENKSFQEANADEERYMVFIHSNADVDSYQVVVFLYRGGQTSGSLPFTGSEFKKVVILCGKHVDHGSRETITVLHAALSRSTFSVLLLCHQESLSKMKSLLSLSTVDQIFEKLRTTDTLGRGLITYLDNRQQDVLEAFRRLIVSRNERQFNSLQQFISECREPGYVWLFDYVESMLLTCFPWAEEIVNMLNNFMRWRPSTDDFSRNIFKHESYLLVKNSANSEEVLEKVDPQLRSTELNFEKMEIPNLKVIAFNAVCWKQKALLKEITQFLKTKIPRDEDFFVDLSQYAISRENLEVAESVLSSIPSSESNIRKVLVKSATFITADMFDKILNESVQLTEIPAQTFLLQRLPDFPFQTWTHQLESTASHEVFERVLNFLPPSVSFSSTSFLDDLGMNILMWAVCNTSIVGMILKRALEQDDFETLLRQKDVNGWSLLRHACYVDNLKVANFLIVEKSFPWSNDMDLGNTTLLEYVETMDQKMTENFTADHSEGLLTFT